MKNAFNVRGPSATVPGAYDVETEDGRVIPVAPSGLPEYQPVPKVEASQGDPTALGEVMTIGQETVMDAGYSRPGLPDKPAKMPIIDMTPEQRAQREAAAKEKAARRVDPSRTTGNDAPPEPVGGAPAPDVPGAPGPNAAGAVAEALALESELAKQGGPRVWTGDPKKTKAVLKSSERVIDDPLAQRLGALGQVAQDKEAEAMAARERMAQTESEAMAAKARAIEEQQKAIAEEGQRVAERQAQIKAQVEAQRKLAMEQDAQADGMRDTNATKDTMRRVVGAIGMFMSGQTGNPQATMQFINANIDDAWRRDMEALKRADGKGDATRSRAAQLLSQMGDERAAFSMFRAEKLAETDAKAERLAMMAGSKNALDKFAEFRAVSEKEQAAAQYKAALSSAPIREVTQEQTRNEGGWRGGPSAKAEKAAREFYEADRKEAAGARSDARKAAYDAQKSGKQADPTKEYETYSRAGSALQEVAMESKKKGGVIFDASDKDVLAMKVRAADALSALGLKSQAKAAEEAESQAELDAIVASGIRDAGSLVSSAKANMSTGARISVKDSERVDAQLAGKLMP